MNDGQDALEQYLFIASDPERRSFASHAVIGNEAADLDSIVSAVVAAFALTTIHGVLYLPVVHMDRMDFLPMRREFSALLRWVAGSHCDRVVSLMTGCIVFLSDEKELNQLLPGNFLLVDHNVPTGIFAKVRVTGVIDHHELQGGSIPAVEPFILERVGSCGSLVFREYRKLLGSFAIKLLLGVAALDTYRNSKEREADLALFSCAHENLEISSSDIDAIGGHLKAVRDDQDFWLSLNVTQRLKMDFKSFDGGELGGSTVRISMVQLLGMRSQEDDSSESNELPNSLESIVRFGSSYRLFFVLADGKHHRQVLFYSREPGLLDALEGLLLADTELQAKPKKGMASKLNASSSPGSDFRVFTILNKQKASRKVVAPMLSGFLKSRPKA